MFPGVPTYLAGNIHRLTAIKDEPLEVSSRSAHVALTGKGHLRIFCDILRVWSPSHLTWSQGWRCQRGFKHERMVNNKNKN